MTTRERAGLSRRGRVRATLLDYLALTKPRTIHLVVGAIPAMLLANRGGLAPWVIVNTLVGAMLMTAGANTLNCVADADIDKLMTRTAARPLARGSVSKGCAMALGLALSVGAFLWLWLTTNLLPALLAIITIAFYVLIYTLLVKRRTSHNVEWGGAANAMPDIDDSTLKDASDEELKAFTHRIVYDLYPFMRAELYKLSGSLEGVMGVMLQPNPRINDDRSPRSE